MIWSCRAWLTAGWCGRPRGRRDLTGLADPGLGPEIVLVRDGSFLGVVAETDRAARLAAGQVARAAQWQSSPSLPDPGDLRGFLLAARSEVQTVVDQPGRRMRRARPPAR